MEEAQELGDVLYRLIKLMVKHPESLSLVACPNDGGILYRITADPRDRGLIIGVNGRTARAIRTILAGLSRTKGIHFRLDIVDPD